MMKRPESERASESAGEGASARERSAAERAQSGAREAQRETREQATRDRERRREAEREREREIHNIGTYYINPLFMALIARNVCKAYEQQTDDKVVLIAEMKSEWSAVAINCLNECYQQCKDATYVFLTKAMPYWDMKSCIDLAVESRNMGFLAQQACKTLIEDAWTWQRMEHKFKCLQDPKSCKERNKFLDIIQAPKTKIAFDWISHLVFVSLFAYVLLIELTPIVPTKEYVLMIWAVTMLVEKSRQCTKDGLSDELPDELSKNPF
ncbi:hypothetical protein DPMN_059966, partial [Dreissena polymorpha]